MEANGGAAFAESFAQGSNKKQQIWGYLGGRYGGVVLQLWS